MISLAGATHTYAINRNPPEAAYHEHMNAFLKSKFISGVSSSLHLRHVISFESLRIWKLIRIQIELGEVIFFRQFIWDMEKIEVF